MKTDLQRFILLCSMMVTIACGPGGELCQLAMADDVSDIKITPGPVSSSPAAKPKTADDSKSKEQMGYEETWEIMELGGQRIGYSHARTYEEQRSGETIIHTSNDTHMTFSRFGQKLQMQMIENWIEKSDGELISFHSERKNPPAGSEIVDGKINGRRLETVTEVAGRKSTQSIDWDPELKSTAYQTRFLKDAKLKTGDQYSFKTFDPSQNQKVVFTFVVEKEQQVAVWGGEKKNLLRLRATQSILPGIATLVFVDEAGEILRTETDMLGQKLITYKATANDALAEVPVGEVDVAVNTLVPVKTALAKGHQSEHAIYKVTLSGGDPILYFPAEGGQSTKRIDDKTLELTIDAVPLPERAETLKADDKYSEFLESAKYIQTDDFRVQEHASRATGNRADPAQVAREMERYVLRKLRKKNYSTALASAAEVAKSLEGDCTEHAVLLAAMLRVKQIPSRVVVGLVYIERQQAFGGHMWTEALIDDVWVPLDATLGKGGTGAGHIKLATSSFSDEAASPTFSFLPLLNVIGKVELDVIESR